MKNLILLVIVFATSTSLFSQEEQTTKKGLLIGGSMNFHYSTGTNVGDLGVNGFGFGDEITSFSFSPFLAKKYSEKWTWGINPVFGVAITEQDIFNPGPPNSQMKEKYFTLGAGVFGRRTINPDNRFQLFLRPSLMYWRTKVTSEVDGVEFDNETEERVQIEIGLGALYAISNKFNATARLGGLSYLRTSTMDEVSFNINGSTIFLGVEMKL